MRPLTEALLSQSRACAALGSPFMGRLMAVAAGLAEAGGPPWDDWHARPWNPATSADSVPLRIAGALHALRRSGDAGLAAVYPPAEASDTALAKAVQDALIREAAFVDAFIASPPQTNEVRRSAMLIAGAAEIAARTGERPMDWLELGASAGLNLRWHRYALQGPGWARGAPGETAALTLAPDWQGPPPPKARLRLDRARGVDLRPLDPTRDAERLCAYLWPDQPDRLALTQAALAVAGPAPDAGDAGDWLASRLAEPPLPGTTRVIAHTVAWQYFPESTLRRAHDAILGAAAFATENAPLAWLRVEADEGGGCAGVTLRLWPGDRRLHLGRADFHGRWIRWAPREGFLPGSPALPYLA